MDAALAAVREDTMADLAEGMPDKRYLELFKIKYDYHNVKALLKAEAVGVPAGRMLMDIGRVPAAALAEAIRDRDLAAFRRARLGFVFQDFNLLDTFSLQDNIFLPLVLAGKKYDEMKKRIDPIAHRLGIWELLQKFPYEVSGGQKQRAAVARALITGPQIVLADEPTGALDSRSSDALLELFGEINAAGQTILMVTHSVKAASHAGRVLFLRDGQVYHQLYRGGESQESQFRRISDTLTVLAGGGEGHA